MVFEIGIGTSQNWDSKEAAEEVIKQAISKLSKPPTFVLLFSTIHYEKNKGFQTILDTIYTKIPKETPLVGGTVAGFMNPSGCYTMGLTALACNSDEIEIATGIGHNTKRNPKKAGEECGKEIEKKLKENKLKNKFVFNVISGPILPAPVRILSLGPFSFLSPILIDFLAIFLQRGIGRESEVLNSLRKELTDYYIIGGSSMDDAAYLRHYQFYNNKILTNSIVAVGIATDLSLKISSTTGLTPSGNQFTVKNTASWNYILKDINGKSAKNEFMKISGWDKQNMDREVHKRTPYFPIGAKAKDGTLHAYPVALFLGDYLTLGHDLVDKQLTPLNITGKKILESSEEALGSEEKHVLSLVVSCAARLEALGRRVYDEKQIFNEKVKNPYIVVYMLGENRGEKECQVHNLQESFNILKIG